MQDIIAFTDEDYHGTDGGTIFLGEYTGFKNTFNIINDREELEKIQGHTNNGIYVRIYDNDGNINHYVRYDVMVSLIRYRDYCRKSNMPVVDIPNVAYIRQELKRFKLLPNK